MYDWHRLLHLYLKSKRNPPYPQQSYRLRITKHNVSNKVSKTDKISDDLMAISVFGKVTGRSVHQWHSWSSPCMPKCLLTIKWRKIRIFTLVLWILETCVEIANRSSKIKLPGDELMCNADKNKRTNYMRHDIIFNQWNSDCFVCLTNNTKESNMLFWSVLFNYREDVRSGW